MIPSLKTSRIGVILAFLSGKCAVSFRPNGTYQLDQYEAPTLLHVWMEAGTYYLDSQVLMTLAPAAPHESSLVQGLLRELTARQLVLDFTFGPDSLRLFKKLAYTRRPA